MTKTGPMAMNTDVATSRPREILGSLVFWAIDTITEYNNRIGCLPASEDEDVDFMRELEVELPDLLLGFRAIVDAVKRRGLRIEDTELLDQFRLMGDGAYDLAVSVDVLARDQCWGRRQPSKLANVLLKLTDELDRMTVLLQDALDDHLAD
jgi:hypothetical protein